MQKNDDCQEKINLRVFITLLVMGTAICIYMIAPFISALAIGGILSALAEKLYHRLQSKGLKGKWAAGLITAFILVLVIVPIAIFSAIAVKQAIGMGAKISQIDKEDVNEFFTTVTNYLPGDYLKEHFADIQSGSLDILKKGGGTLATRLMDLVKEIPSFILQAFLTCLGCFFFLIDGSKFLTWITSKIPLDADIKKEIATTIKDTAISVVWASMAAAAAQALVMFIGYFVLGVPGAVIAAGATFILAWIPLVGSTPIFIVGVILLAIKSSYVKLGFMIAFGILAGTIDNLVRPIVLKGRGEMHPLVSLVAIFGGLELFGFVGVFFGPIIAAMVISLFKIWPRIGLRNGFKVGGQEKVLIETEGNIEIKK